MQDCLDIARRFHDYAILVHTAAAALTSKDGSSMPPPGVPDAGTSGTRGISNAEVDVSGELVRLFEVLMNSLLQKIGVLLQARQGSNSSLEVSDWQGLLRFTYEALDKVRSLQEQCKHKLNPKDSVVGADVRAGVRAILYTQTKNIVEEFNQKRMAQMQCVLEQERWERTDVPAEYKHILEQLLGRQLPSQADTSEQQGVERYLHVDGLPFIVVPAVLTLVQLLNAYARLCRDFEALAGEIIQRMCNLLRLFNQKTHSLVLGGQAVQKQVLKKITASNLALCSQCCGLMAQVLPAVQANLLAILEQQHARATSAAPSAPSRQVVAALAEELTKIAAEFSEHRGALFSKLSDLLRERYEHHAKKWLSSVHPEVKGDAFGSEGEEVKAQAIDLTPHEALDGLVKDITSMYRVLLKNLTGDSVRRIFAKAFEDISVRFEQRLGQELSAPTPPYEERVGRSLGDRLAMDIAFLQEQLEKLSGISTPLQRLLFDLLHHLQTKLPADEPTKALHPSALEVLQRTGRVPR